MLASPTQQKLLSTLYPQLEDSTQTLLALYDTYLEPAISNGEIPKLRSVISEVGMQLDALFDLEDQMLLSTELVGSREDSPQLVINPLATETVKSSASLSSGMLDS